MNSGASPECEQRVAGFLQAVGDGAAFEAPFPEERLSPGLNLAARRGVDHVGGQSFEISSSRRSGAWAR